MGVKYNFKGLKEVAEKFDKVAKYRKALLKGIALALESGAISRFKEERDPEGKKWLPNQRGGQILTLKGYLRGSIVGQATADYAEVGTPLVYSAIHQFGGTIRFKKRNGAVQMPKRAYLGVSKEDEVEIADVIETYLSGALV